MTQSLVSSRHVCAETGHKSSHQDLYLASQSFSAVLHTSTLVCLTLELLVLDTDSPVLTNFDKLPDVLVHYNALAFMSIIKPLIRVAINEGLM